ncbi:MAG: aspartate-semialdehyde dehydrogenase [Bacteroidota bacterium]
MKVAVIGATGLVGRMMIKVLEERNFPVTELILAASDRSVGKVIEFKGKPVTMVSVADAISAKPRFAFFSAGGSASKHYAPLFAANGTVVIDNSSAWRMDDSIKLVVPEVNGGLLTADDKIIANPNCSTIQMVVALNPLHKKYGIKRLVISTYQAVSGTGQKAMDQIQNERAGISGPMAYHYPIDLNCIPHGGDFLDDGYTTEEVKLVNETRKILGDQTINITATVVRVPVLMGHSECVNIEFHKEFDLKEAVQLLRDAPGIIVMDNPETNTYPMPLMAAGKDEVFVGRIRRDHSQPCTMNIWVVADNLRKGAASNAIQIAEAINS